MKLVQVQDGRNINTALHCMDKSYLAATQVRVNVEFWSEISTNNSNGLGRDRDEGKDLAGMIGSERGNEIGVMEIGVYRLTT